MTKTEPKLQFEVCNGLVRESEAVTETHAGYREAAILAFYRGCVK